MPNFENSLINLLFEVTRWISNYISSETMVVITYPCPNFSQALMVKGAPGVAGMETWVTTIPFRLVGLRGNNEYSQSTHKDSVHIQHISRSIG